MDLPPGATPPEGVSETEAAIAASFFRIRGILFRVLGELEKTPKPWPNNVKAARNACLKALTISQEEWNALPQALRTAAVPPPSH